MAISSPSLRRRPHRAAEASSGNTEALLVGVGRVCEGRGRQHGIRCVLRRSARCTHRILTRSLGRPRARRSTRMSCDAPRCPGSASSDLILGWRPGTVGPPVAATGHSTACASWSAQVLRSSDVDASQSDAFDRPMRARARAQNARLCAFGAAAPPARGAARRVDEHTRPESGALLRRADAQRGREEEVCPRTRATAFLRSYYGEGTLRQLSDTRTRHSRGTLSPMRAYASRSNSTSLASARTTASQLWAPANECQVGAPGEAAESLRGA